MQTGNSLSAGCGIAGRWKRGTLKCTKCGARRPFTYKNGYIILDKRIDNANTRALVPVQPSFSLGLAASAHAPLRAAM
jgi:hypothetical protein